MMRLNIRGLIFLIGAVLVAGTFARPINDGNKLFAAGDYEGALKKYMEAREAEPANPMLFYNIGTCQYKLGNFEEAKKELESAVRMPDKKMAAKAAYNLANTHFRMGEKAAEGSERIAAWRESVAYLKRPSTSTTISRTRRRMWNLSSAS